MKQNGSLLLRDGPWMPCGLTCNPIHRRSTWWFPMPAARACCTGTCWGEPTRYRDLLGGTYQAVPLNRLPPGAHGLVAADINHDSYTDLDFEPGGRLLNRAGDLQSVPRPGHSEFPAGSAAADFTGNGD